MTYDNIQSKQSNSSGVFIHNRYLVRRQIFKLFGAAFHIYDPTGRVAFYSKMKAFKLKEDIRLYTGEDMATEVLAIEAKVVLDNEDLVMTVAQEIGLDTGKGLVNDKTITFL